MSKDGRGEGEAHPSDMHYQQTTWEGKKNEVENSPSPRPSSLKKKHVINYLSHPSSMKVKTFQRDFTNCFAYSKKSGMRLNQTLISWQIDIYILS